MTDCPRIDMLFGGCRFEARYDKSPARILDGKAEGLAAIEALRQVTYVHDICIRCGKIVRRA